MMRIGLVRASRALIVVSLVAPMGTMPVRRSAREVEIIAFDYTFKAPSELPAGRTSFRLVNQGQHRHEFNVALLKPGATAAQFIAAAKEGTVGPTVEATVGVLFAGPGGRSPSELTTDLLPGRTYVVHCVLRDSPTAPRHDDLGMYTEIRVASTKPVAAPPLAVDTIIAMDYAYRYPATLAAGTHYFALINRGVQRHEINLARLKEGVTLKQLLDVPPDRPIRSLLDQTLGVLHSPGGTAPIGLLRFEMLPGRDYVFLCSFMDSAGAPPHFQLGMYGGIRAVGANR